jgi:hypothetical protein
MALARNASCDIVGVAAYDVFKAGIKAGSPTSTTYTLTGLACATTYAVGVRSVDVAGNASAQTTASLTTSACGTTTPTATGYPDASNTGVPAGTTLTAYTGPSTISTPNTVISGKTMGCINVVAEGVVIRNSRISCSGSAVNVNDPVLYGKTPLLIEDSEITCNNGSGATGVAEAHFTLRRVNIHHCENGLSVNQDVTIEDSYIHDLDMAEGAHTDGIQLSFGHWNGSSYPCCAKNVTVRHNTILGGDDAGHFATSAIISNKLGPDENVLIDGNLMAGGAYTLFCDQQGFTGINYRVTNNRFSTRYSSKVGYFGASTDCSDEVRSGNVIHETGQSLSLG